MDILVKAGQLVLSLSILIILHEMGHFIFAKFFKCRVEKFYLFFDMGFSLFKFKKGETEYGMGWLPLGGYVKIAGMIDESMDKDQMKQPIKPYEFRAKKTYQRLLIMLGGVMMNFLAALIIYIGVLYVWGDKYLPNENAKFGIEVSEAGEQIGFRNGDKIVSVDNKVIDDFYAILLTIVLDKAKTVQIERDGRVFDLYITDDDIALMLKEHNIFGVRVPFSVKVAGFPPNSPAQLAGITVNDQIVTINHTEIEFYDQFTALLKNHKNEEVVVTVSRNNQFVDIPVTLKDDGLLGISLSHNLSDVFEMKVLKYGFLESIPAGIKLGWQTSVDYLKQFKLIFNRKTKGYESLGGFISIGKIFPSIWNWHQFWNMTAFLSIILGIMNILPIPALDGGHVMFVLYEMITGRKPNDKFVEYAQLIGLSLLLLLILYANANDILRLFK
ncbi:MAG TPA: RIP metalloprotease RseP [Prolixibacteraceae bacterium]|nr:RIP metalloprotease RseP [Prolixibacteraceae bacterium]